VIKRKPIILHISSETSEIKKVETVLKNFFIEHNLAEKYFNKVFLCISEAVTDSIEHGNKKDRNKKVTILLWMLKNKLFVEIKDEGDGFNYENLESPIEKNNLKKETGRGIFIIKNMVDNLSFNDCGNTLQLEIKCQ